MADGVAITSREELEAWLKDRAPEFAQAIAARVALRILPLVRPVISAERIDQKANRQVILRTLRASLISWAARKYPAHDMRAFAAAASSGAAFSVLAASANARSTDTFAYAADAARFAAADAAARAAANAAARAADAYRNFATSTANANAEFADQGIGATGYKSRGTSAQRARDAQADAVATDSAAAAAVVWESIGVDAAWLEKPGTGVSASEIALDLVNQALWMNEVYRIRKDRPNQPDWARAALDGMAHDEGLKAEGFSIWIDWYRKLLPNPANGTSNSHFGEALDIKIATQPDEWWKREPAEVNADIADWLALAPLAAAPQEQLGNNWVAETTQFSLKQTGDATDVSASLDRLTVQLHDGLKRRIKDFALVALRVRDDHGWDNFVPSFERFAQAFGCATDEMPENLGTIYDVALEFVSFIEQDDDLRRRPKGNLSALDPERRRAFENIVLAAAPLIRRFPTILEIDDAAGAYLGKLPDRLAAAQLVEKASAAELISEYDRKLLMDMLALLREQGHLSGKASVRGIFTVKNLIIASLSSLATVYTGAIGSNVALESPLAKRASDFVGRSESEITEFLANAPADLRHSLRILLERIGQDPNRPNFPGTAAAPHLPQQRQDGEDADD